MEHPYNEKMSNHLRYSGARSSVGRIQDLNIISNYDEEATGTTTTTSTMSTINKRRVSFNNKFNVKEFNAEEQTVHVKVAPEYEEHLSCLSSDSSCQPQTDNSGGSITHSEFVEHAQFSSVERMEICYSGTKGAEFQKEVSDVYRNNLSCIEKRNRRKSMGSCYDFNMESTRGISSEIDVDQTMAFSPFIDLNATDKSNNSGMDVDITNEDSQCNELTVSSVDMKNDDEESCDESDMSFTRPLPAITSSVISDFKLSDMPDDLSSMSVTRGVSSLGNSNVNVIRLSSVSDNNVSDMSISSGLQSSGNNGSDMSITRGFPSVGLHSNNNITKSRLSLRGDNACDMSITSFEVVPVVPVLRFQNLNEKNESRGFQLFHDDNCNKLSLKEEITSPENNAIDMSMSSRVPSLMKDSVSDMSMTNLAPSLMRNSVSDMSMTNRVPSLMKDNVSDMSVTNRFPSLMKDNVGDMSMTNRGSSLIRDSVSDMSTTNRVPSLMKDNISDMSVTNGIPLLRNNSNLSVPNESSSRHVNYADVNATKERHSLRKNIAHDKNLSSGQLLVNLISDKGTAGCQASLNKTVDAIIIRDNPVIASCYSNDVNMTCPSTINCAIDMSLSNSSSIAHPSSNSIKINSAHLSNFDDNKISITGTVPQANNPSVNESKNIAEALHDLRTTEAELITEADTSIGNTSCISFTVPLKNILQDKTERISLSQNRYSKSNNELRSMINNKENVISNVSRHCTNFNCCNEVSQNKENCVMMQNSSVLCEISKPTNSSVCDDTMNFSYTNHENFQFCRNNRYSSALNLTKVSVNEDLEAQKNDMLMCQNTDVMIDGMESKTLDNNHFESNANLNNLSCKQEDFIEPCNISSNTNNTFNIDINQCTQLNEVDKIEDKNKTNISLDLISNEDNNDSNHSTVNPSAVNKSVYNSILSSNNEDLHLNTSSVVLNKDKSLYGEKIISPRSKFTENVADKECAEEQTNKYKDIVKDISSEENRIKNLQISEDSSKLYVVDKGTVVVCLPEHSVEIYSGNVTNNVILNSHDKRSNSTLVHIINNESNKEVYPGVLQNDELLKNYGLTGHNNTSKIVHKTTSNDFSNENLHDGRGLQKNLNVNHFHCPILEAHESMEKNGRSENCSVKVNNSHLSSKSDLQPVNSNKYGNVNNKEDDITSESNSDLTGVSKDISGDHTQISENSKAENAGRINNSSESNSKEQNISDSRSPTLMNAESSGSYNNCSKAVTDEVLKTLDLTTVTIKKRSYRRTFNESNSCVTDDSDSFHAGCGTSMTDKHLHANNDVEMSCALVDSCLEENENLSKSVQCRTGFAPTKRKSSESCIDDDGDNGLESPLKIPRQDEEVMEESKTNSHNPANASKPAGDKCSVDGKDSESFFEISAKESISESIQGNQVLSLLADCEVDTQSSLSEKTYEENSELKDAKRRRFPFSDFKFRSHDCCCFKYLSDNLFSWLFFDGVLDLRVESHIEDGSMIIKDIQLNLNEPEEDMKYILYFARNIVEKFYNELQNYVNTSDASPLLNSIIDIIEQNHKLYKKLSKYFDFGLLKIAKDDKLTYEVVGSKNIWFEVTMSDKILFHQVSDAEISIKNIIGSARLSDIQHLLRMCSDPLESQLLKFITLIEEYKNK